MKNNYSVLVPQAQQSPSNLAPVPQRPRQWRMANVISADHRRYLTNLYLNRELDRFVIHDFSDLSVHSSIEIDIIVLFNFGKLLSLISIYCRLASFTRWAAGRQTVSPESLAKAGFFYLGDADRTQCFSCGGVLRNWTSSDSAQVCPHLVNILT